MTLLSLQNGRKVLRYKMSEPDQELLVRLQKIADQPRSFEDRLKTMNDLYETNSYHPQVPPAPALGEDDDED